MLISIIKPFVLTVRLADLPCLWFLTFSICVCTSDRILVQCALGCRQC